MSFQGAANQPGGELASPAGDGPPLFRVSQSPGKGMGLFATRDIKAGTVVLREKFTLSVPGKNNGGYSRLDLDAIVKLTLQYNNLSQDTRAELLQLHATPMPHRDADVRNLITAADRHAGVPPMGERAVETCQRIVGVWLTNGFLTSDERTGTCLFLKASRINHSCVANTARYFEKNDPRYITIRATRDIKADEEITLTYADALLPVAERQEKTRRVWHFTCACPACDPNDPAIDSAAHERDIRDLQSLENDPTPGSEASREELSAALERSSRRIELHQKLLSSPAQLATEYFTSTMLCSRLCLITGDIKNKIRELKLLELASTQAKLAYGTDSENYTVVHEKLDGCREELSAIIKTAIEATHGLG